MQQHVVMQLRDHPAAGGGEHARYDGVNQTGDSAGQHAQSESGGDKRMLAIALTDSLGMIDE